MPTVYTIFTKNGKLIKANPNKRPRTFKELRSFLVNNGGFDCFSKAMNKVYKISRENACIEVTARVDDLTLLEYLELSKK